MTTERIQQENLTKRAADRTHTRLARIVAGILAAATIFGVSAAWIAGSMLIGSSHQRVGDLPAGLPVLAVEFPSTSGATLRGWMFTGNSGHGALIMMHGLRANRLAMLDRARFLSAAGYTILLFDFQAHGESSGEEITFGYLEGKDARAAVDFIKLKLPNDPIGVIGVSMGGAAALLASPGLDVDAMVLEEVYPDIKTAIADRLQMALGGWARTLTPLLSLQMKPRLGISADDMRPIDRIGRIQVPKLIIAGSEDRHTKLEESRELFDAAADPKELWVVEGAAHTDMYSYQPDEYRRRILAFLESTFKPLAH